MDETKKLIPILHQKWKYLPMWKRHFFSKEYFTNSWNQRQNKWKKAISRIKYI